jgi:uncharacterized protein YjiS (DUF1127 family)/uncharacterized membrane protein
VLSRRFIARSSALGFLTVGMGCGAAMLVLAGCAGDRMTVIARLGAPQWIAGAYLGIAGGALAFILWVLALQRTTPTRVAATMTVNPIAAALLAAPLVGEPITPNLVLGVIAVGLGIGVATSEPRAAGLTRLTGRMGRPGAALVRLIAWMISRRAHARSRQRLAGLDDRLLRDIGIDRTVVDDDSTSAFWRLRRLPAPRATHEIRSSGA